MPQTSDDSVFDDIRPCRDDEVDAELQKIIQDRTVINGILKFQSKSSALASLVYKLPAFMQNFLVGRFLSRQVREIHTVADFQLRVANFMRSMSKTPADGVTYRGFDRLDPKLGYLFISNHRDISLDPAYIDMALYAHEMPTVRIAIGDNLLRMPVATSLMRLNKSFIVKRSVTSPREKLKELTKLSEYIGLSIKENNSIWIAEREGRAKDGNDRAETAVLKMLGLAGRLQKKSFAEYMASLRIVPVSITYEFDPNDMAKAGELSEREKHNGEYHKEKMEDIDTITRGIRGYKGRVSVVAGEPLSSGFSNAEELAAIIDRFVWDNYQMYPSTLISAGHGDRCTDAERKKFEDRINGYPEELRGRIRSMYARPYFNLHPEELPEAGDAKEPEEKA